MEINQITSTIIGLAIKVHTELGPGLYESVYESCLAHELIKAGIQIEQQIRLPVIYDNIHLENGFRADLFVEGRVIVEVKSIETLLPIHQAQVLTYLKLSNAEIGILINFNVAKLTNGVKRFIKTKK